MLENMAVDVIVGDIIMISAGVTAVFTLYNYITKKINTRLYKLEEVNKLQLKVMHSIIEHIITGNHIENMKATEKEIIDIITKM